MSMRILTPAEFCKLLEDNGFERTEEQTKEHTVWHHKETDRLFTVPNHAESYPDFILDVYLTAVGKLYIVKDENVAVSKKYTVTTPPSAALSIVKEKP